MITAMAKPRPEKGSIIIRFEADKPISEVHRINGDGNKVPVRVLKETPPTKMFIVEDYEAPFNTQIIYTATAGEETGEIETILETEETFLSLPQLPGDRAAIDTVTDYSAEWRMPGSVDVIIGRTDPLVTILPLSLRQGTIKYVFFSHEQMLSAQRLYSMNYPLLLRLPEHDRIDLYHTSAAVSARPVIKSGVCAWELTVNYVEQNRPGGYLIKSVGWYYSNILKEFTTYQHLVNSYTNCGDVIGDWRK